MNFEEKLARDRRILAGLRAGEKIEYIAAVARCSRATVQRVARSANLSRAQGRPRSIDHDLVRRRFAAGETKSAIARSLGCSRVWIRRILTARCPEETA